MKSKRTRDTPLHKHELRAEVQTFKRRRILEASQELFFEQGYAATTLDTIAATLNVTKPFLYSYFRNKHEILNAICDMAIRSRLAALENALVAKKMAPRDQLRLAIERVTHSVLMNQQCTLIYRREELQLSPEERGALDKLSALFDRKLSSLFELGAKSGDFAYEDTDLTASSVGGLLVGLALWYRPTNGWSHTEVARNTIRNVERMVGCNLTT